MPQKLIALLAGNTEGPWLYTAPFSKPQLVIKGLIEGIVRVNLFNADGLTGDCRTIEVGENGSHGLPSSQKMKVYYDGPPCPSLQCTIVSR